MVVQHNMQSMNANRVLGITTGQQAKSTEKLSSGYKINRAADDAAGLSISEKMRRQIRGLDRASTNAQDGVSAVQTAEGALNEVHDMLQRMNELANQAANGTNSLTDRQSIQDEISQLNTEIDRVAETTKFNELYLMKGAPGTKEIMMKGHDAGLKGTLSDTGDTATFTAELTTDMDVQISGKNYHIYDDKDKLENLQSQVEDADTVTINGTTYTRLPAVNSDIEPDPVKAAELTQKAAEKTGSAAELETSAAALKASAAAKTGSAATKEASAAAIEACAATRSSSAAGKKASAAAIKASAASLRACAAKLSGSASYISACADAKATKAADKQQAADDKLAAATAKREAANSATGQEKYNLEAEAAVLEASASALSASAATISASAETKKACAEIKKGSAGKVSACAKIRSACAEGKTACAETVAACAKKLAACANTKKASAATLTASAKVKTASAESKAKDADKLRGSAAALTASATALNGGVPADPESVLFKTPDRQYLASELKGMIVDGAKVGINGAQARTAVDTINNKDNITLNDALDNMEYALRQANLVGVDDTTKVTVTRKEPEGDNYAFDIQKGSVTVANDLSFDLHVGADADMTNKIGVNIATMSSKYLGVQGLQVADDSGIMATYAIDAVEDAIQKVNEQRSALGAVQNRLEHTINNLDNVVENTTAAESRIRDTDIAEEMVRYSKNNILAQAGQSMLAQANQSTQGALSLLG